MSLELIQAAAADGVVLSGTLRVPATPASPRTGADAVILHHGIGGNFYNPHFFDAMTEKLLARGCAVLRVNNRGHDIAYGTPQGRLGAAFESVDDCRLDWSAWIERAESLGFRRLGLWGHSLGAVKTVYFLARQDDPRLVWGIAASPPRFSCSDFLSRPDAHLFKAHLDEAARRAARGEAESVFPVTVPTAVLMSARTYLDKYGPDERFDIVKLLPQVSLPLLLTIGAKEGATPDGPERFSFRGLAELIAPLARERAGLTFAHIAGADHWYRDRTGELWSAVESWLDAQDAGSRAAARAAGNQ